MIEVRNMQRKASIPIPPIRIISIKTPVLRCFVILRRQWIWSGFWSFVPSASPISRDRELLSFGFEFNPFISIDGIILYIFRSTNITISSEPLHQQVTACDLLFSPSGAINSSSHICMAGSLHIAMYAVPVWKPGTDEGIYHILVSGDSFGYPLLEVDPEETTSTKELRYQRNGRVDTCSCRSPTIAPGTAGMTTRGRFPTAPQ